MRIHPLLPMLILGSLALGACQPSDDTRAGEAASAPLVPVAGETCQIPTDLEPARPYRIPRDEVVDDGGAVAAHDEPAVGDEAEVGGAPVLDGARGQVVARRDLDEVQRRRQARRQHQEHGRERRRDAAPPGPGPDRGAAAGGHGHQRLAGSATRKQLFLADDSISR